MTPSEPSYRVLMFEVNEVSWALMGALLRNGHLPNFRKLRDQGISAETVADEPPGLLDPWITWTKVFTGVPQCEHGTMFLEQPRESLRTQRVWDIVDEAGRKVGVFGTPASWPPKPVRGFFVPGSFSPDSDTYPSHLRPIQDLNLRYTRAHAPGARSPGLAYGIRSAWKLTRLGLDVSTILSVASTLAEIRVHPDRNWKMVSLQPLVNFAVFRNLYRSTRPDFATFHTNHVAHYQHRFYRAWRPDLFEDVTDPLEIKRFKGAIPYGYGVADRVLGGFTRICDEEADVVLCVASSMGQQPFLPARHNRVAPKTCRIRSIARLLEILRIHDKCEYFSTMAPQWNISIDDCELMETVIHHLGSARYMPLDKSMYSVQRVNDRIVLTPISHHGIDSSTQCVFPTLDGSPRFPLDELVVQADETRKSGCHHAVGMLAFYGKAVRKGEFWGRVNNLDIAPTLLDLMGIPVPGHMKGMTRRAAILHRSSN